MSLSSKKPQFPSHYSPDYRHEIVQFVMNRIAAGDSCPIVGVSVTAKSNCFGISSTLR
jgi:hypothetical protein